MKVDKSKLLGKHSLFEFNKDLFWLLAVTILKVKDITTAKITLEHIYTETFRKNGQPEIQKHWFPLVEVYLRNRELLRL